VFRSSLTASAATSQVGIISSPADVVTTGENGTEMIALSLRNVAPAYSIPPYANLEIEDRVVLGKMEKASSEDLGGSLSIKPVGGQPRLNAN
jgi:hypothetical protein